MSNEMKPREEYPQCPNCKLGRMSVNSGGSLWCDRCESCVTESKRETSNGNPMHAEFASAMGMTLRDYFAAKVINGIIASFAGVDIRMPGPEELACDAYRYADAMIAARSQQKDGA